MQREVWRNLVSFNPPARVECFRGLDHSSHPEADGVIDLLPRETEPGQDVSSVNGGYRYLAVVRAGITVASEPDVLDGWTKAEYSTARSDKKFLAILTLHASGWANGCMINLQMSDQTGRVASLRAPAYHMAPNKVSVCLRLSRPKPESGEPHSQNPGGRLTLDTWRADWLRCGSDYVVNGNGWSEVWQRPYWVPTCPSQACQASWVRLGPACNVLQSGIKTTRKVESDRFGHNFAISMLAISVSQLVAPWMEQGRCQI